MTLTQRHKDSWPQGVDKRHNKLYVVLEDNKYYEKKETRIKEMMGGGRKGGHGGGETIV